MFTNAYADTQRLKQQREADIQQRRRVLYLADRVVLAAHHKRPKHEIDQMLDELRRATEVKGN